MLTPMKAIRKKCLDCCCFSFTEVKLCTAEDCTLWPYRFGKRPSTVSRKAKIAEKSALENARQKQADRENR